MRIGFEEMYNTLKDGLEKNGVGNNLAEICAKILTQNSCDGVYSHGLNIFPSIVKNIRKGIIDIHAKPEMVQEFGACEVWDGKCGLGIINANFVMEQAIKLSKKFGVGCASIRNTNHWCRAGTYAMQAADCGCIGICWTNTTANMPAWGSKKVNIGNNPIAVSIPREGGHFVLDMALSQFSIGKMKILRVANEKLPVFGGYNKEGELTTEPSDILESGRALPIGFWKGSGLAIMLDLLASILSGGNTTFDITKFEAEQKVSQVFLAVNVEKFSDKKFITKILDETINSLHGDESVNEEEIAYFPGERLLKIRAENSKNGIPVDEAIWQTILEMAKQKKPGE